MYHFRQVVATLLLICISTSWVHGDFEITSLFRSPDLYTEQQRKILDENLDRAERLWESVLLGHTGSDDDVEFFLTIVPQRTGLASAIGTAFTQIGDHVMATHGTMFINVDEIENTDNGFGNPGVRILDELLVHEIGHALGFGTLWTANSLYENETGEYVGEHALAAYQAEFDSEATFVPVELAGPRDSRNAHWDQLFRSSPQEGNPNDPFSLSPLTGIVDARGRDFGQDVMSPALDADYGEPFLSNTTVQAMRDLGFRTVTSFPFEGDIDGDGFVDIHDVDALAGLVNEGNDNAVYDVDSDGIVSQLDRHHLLVEILDTNFGDANLDGQFDSSDLVLVSQAAQYRDETIGNSIWSTGDWDGDREFDTGDLLLAFKTGTYERPNVRAVPEPSFSLSWAVIVLSMLSRTSSASPK